MGECVRKLVILVYDIGLANTTTAAFLKKNN